jgi:2-succinyl-5-enolpyruvyl-6-hydroxy-3-cyclohexene-1-carboxylate synthase
VNPSTALARVVVDELVRGGVGHIVLAPGSRSAPLAYAAYDAASAGRLRLHVRVDERGAGFLALGLARATGTPAVVVTTSGTAVANLHPAVLEAHHDAVPLLVVSADRPPELRGVGANQTADQRQLFGPALRLWLEVGPAEERIGSVAVWRSTVARAVVTAAGGVGHPGPVQLNVALREPLVPDPDGPATGEGEDWTEPLAGRVGGRPWTRAPRLSVRGPVGGPAPLILDRLTPTLVIAGHGAGTAARGIAEDADWPLLAEPASGSWGGPQLVPAGDFLLRSKEFMAANPPRRVVVVGRPTLSRAVRDLLADARLEVVAIAGHAPEWADPARDVRVVATGIQTRGRAHPRWARTWRLAGAEAWLAVHDAIDAEPFPTEPGIARDLVSAIPRGSTLLLASSQPIRDVALAAAPRADLRVLANRGVSGIDGTLSTAIGAALGGTGPTFALVGDLAFVHDSNALAIGPDEQRPTLTIVVVDNDGGGIFGLLEQGRPDLAEPFERLFATPVRVDLAMLCGAYGVTHQVVTSSAKLREALAEPDGLRVLQVVTDRRQARGVHERLLAAALDRLR